MKVSDAMNINFARIRQHATMSEAAEVAATSQASDLMVIDEADGFVGVLSEGDLIRTVMPSFEDMMAQAQNFSDALDTFVKQGRESADQPVAGLVITDPLCYGPDDDLVKAAGTMVAKQIRCLPVVDDGTLVGVVSRADIARAVLRA